MTIYQCTIAGTMAGVEEWANVYHVDTGAGPDASAAAMADAFGDAYIESGTPGFLNNVHPDIIANTFTRRDLDTQAQPETVTINRPGGSVATATSLPFDVSMVVSWRTAFAGRRSRGRTYLPPPVTTAIVTGANGRGLMTSLVQANIADAAAKLGNRCASEGFPLVIWSTAARDSVGALLPPAAFPITDLYVDNEFDTQRRRGVGLPKTRSSRILVLL